LQLIRGTNGDTQNNFETLESQLNNPSRKEENYCSNSSQLNSENLAFSNSRSHEKILDQTDSSLSTSFVNASKTHQAYYFDEKKPPKINRNSKFRYSNYMIDPKNNTSSFKSSSSALQTNQHSNSSTNLNFIKNSIVSNCIMKFEKQLTSSHNLNENLDGSNGSNERLNNLESTLKNNSSISIRKVKTYFYANYY